MNTNANTRSAHALVRLKSILNAVGSRQGCSLGSLLYCIAIHPLLLKLQSEYLNL